MDEQRLTTELLMGRPAFKLSNWLYGGLVLIEAFLSMRVGLTFLGLTQGKLEKTILVGSKIVREPWLSILGMIVMPILINMAIELLSLRRPVLGNKIEFRRKMYA